MTKKGRRYSIYALCDPRPEYQGPEFEFYSAKGVRYVGQTFKPLSHRFSQHLKEEANPYKRNWIRSLRRIGLEPLIVALRTDIEGYEDADRVETQMIAEARAKIGDKLVNLAKGGHGGYYSDEQLEESRTRAMSGVNGYVRPGNTPYPTLRDLVSPSVREQMLVKGNLRIEEIDYTAQRSSLKQLSTIQVGTKSYTDAYRAGFSGRPLPPGKLVVEAGYLHGVLAREGHAESLGAHVLGETEPTATRDTTPPE